MNLDVPGSRWTQNYLDKFDDVKVGVYVLSDGHIFSLPMSVLEKEQTDKPLTQL